MCEEKEIQANSKVFPSKIIGKRIYLHDMIFYVQEQVIKNDPSSSSRQCNQLKMWIIYWMYQHIEHNSSLDYTIEIVTYKTVHGKALYFHKEWVLQFKCIYNWKVLLESFPMVCRTMLKVRSVKSYNPDTLFQKYI